MPSIIVPSFLPITSHAKVGVVKNHAADYSGESADVAKVTVPTGYVYCLRKLVIQLETAGAIVLEKFGDIVALGTGITFKLFNDDDDALFDFLDGGAMVSNFEIFEYFDEVFLGSAANPTAAGLVQAHLDLTHFHRDGIFLPEGYYLGIGLNDDLSDLDGLEFMVQGYAPTHDLDGSLKK